MNTNTQGSGTKQVKLMVNTADEAVKVLRERYGDAARVLSVKQVEQGGLKKLVSKPRLEVIVEVDESALSETRQPASQPAKTAAATPAQPQQPAQNERQPKATPEAAPQQPVSGKGMLGRLYQDGPKPPSVDDAKGGDSGYFSQFAEEEVPVARATESVKFEEEAPLGSAANPVRSGTLDAVKRAISMLESVGFDRTLIERVRAEVDFKDIGSLPTMDLYAKICDWLRGRFPQRADAPLGVRRAFIGTSGSGKTSALCKMLSSSALSGEAVGSVLKVDSDLPNPSDALEVFCDIMGAQFCRSADEVNEVSSHCPLLVDTPGFVLGDADSVFNCRELLDELGIEDRILVVNAAYESELIADILATGDSLGANRVVFTHLDETRRTGKLWKFLLNRRITPLFFSQGPNPAGEYTADTYSYLLERTFPNGRDLAASSRRSRERSDSRILEKEVYAGV